MPAPSGLSLMPAAVSASEVATMAAAAGAVRPGPMSVVPATFGSVVPAGPQQVKVAGVEGAGCSLCGGPWLKCQAAAAVVVGLALRSRRGLGAGRLPATAGTTTTTTQRRRHSSVAPRCCAAASVAVPEKPAQVAAGDDAAARGELGAEDLAVNEDSGTAQAKRLQFRLGLNQGTGTVTTPLFYSNGSPHIGSAYPTIVADVMARYAKMHGAEVHFVTGMDEHGEKIARTAEEKKQKPQELVDDIAAEFQGLWKQLSINNDHFARTTQDVHKQLVAEMWQRCADKGDIYKKDYEGYYCVGCEAYLDADEMQEGNVCKIHQKPCELRREENYFFRLSNYWDQVRDHLEANPDFILPKSRRNEVLYWLRDDNKRDFSISRTSTTWGIQVPGDESQVIYVWFDALLGYLSSLLQPGDPPTLDSALQRGWPADVHVIGKDIMRFHVVYWPAMLMSAGLPLPKHVASHGFLTKDGLKMGKSLGNVVEPVPLVENFGADAVRYYFAGCLNFGDDGDFSYDKFIARVNAGLANELGNLLHRLLTLCRKNLLVPEAPDTFLTPEERDAHPVYQAAVQARKEVQKHYESFNFVLARSAALNIANTANTHINVVQPWAKLKPDKPEEEIEYALREMMIMAEGVRICALLLSPLTPGLSARVLKELGGDADLHTSFSWEETAWAGHRALPGLGKAMPKPKPMFQRIDIEAWKDK